MTEIKFINHASVLICDNEVRLLSDPWYFGSIFHDGWDLIYSNSEFEIDTILNTVTHIWISHEHPDHFSVGFFKKYKAKLISQGVQILFQKTNDKRVLKFLTAQGFDVLELDFNVKVNLSRSFQITCFKDGFYDSGLYVRTSDTGVLNLNDCEVRSVARVNEIKKVIGPVDVLLTQFSYAAWKGGIDNVRWRREAALEKLETVKLQVEHFKPGYVIPIASFVYFSNVENFYLNDSVNSVADVEKSLEHFPCAVVCMKPMDSFEISDVWDNDIAIKYWSKKQESISIKNRYETCSFDVLNKSFVDYRSRIVKNNNIKFMSVMRLISPIKILRKLNIYLHDLEITVCFDLFSSNLKVTDENANLEMHSSMLNFILNNGFGFDTLTINGCFSEKTKGAFVTATKTLSIENLNNLGISMKFSILFQWKVIWLFLNRLYRVMRKLD